MQLFYGWQGASIYIEVEKYLGVFVDKLKSKIWAAHKWECKKKQIK